MKQGVCLSSNVEYNYYTDSELACELCGDRLHFPKILFRNKRYSL